MALQTRTSTMSSSPNTALPAAGTPSSDPDPGEGASLNTKNSVPFSFLIAFLALFVVFMGMGLWARRIVFFARRRMGLPVPEPPPRQRDIKPRKPVLWDVYPDKRRQAERWHAITVSTRFCRSVPNCVPIYLIYLHLHRSHYLPGTVEKSYPLFLCMNPRL